MLCLTFLESKIWDNLNLDMNRITCLVEVLCRRGFSLSAIFASAGRTLAENFNNAVSHAWLGPLYIHIFISINKISKEYQVQTLHMQCN